MILIFYNYSYMYILLRVFSTLLWYDGECVILNRYKQWYVVDSDEFVVVFVDDQFITIYRDNN